MIKVTLLSIVVLSTLAFALDSDLDGVEDSNDKCPNSVFTDLVDKDGCKVDSTISNHHFDIILGYSQSKESQSNTTSGYKYSSKLVNLDYYYKKLSLSLSLSDYNYDNYSNSNNGFNDLYINAKYKFALSKSLSFQVGPGVIIPSASSETNKIDYSLSASLNWRAYEDLSIFTGGSYNFIGDQNSTATIDIYQNSTLYYGGIGTYPTTNSYLSLSYSNVSSIYVGSANKETLYLSGSYNFTNHYFTIVRYGHGLNDAAADNYISMQIGYFF